MRPVETLEHPHRGGAQLSEPALQPIATLTCRQRRAATLEAMGHTTDDIARTMGVHRATVFRWRRTEGYRSTVATLATDAQRAARLVLEVHAVNAAARLADLLDSPDERIALRAALAVLDRTGHGPGQRVDLSVAACLASEPVDSVGELARLMAGDVSPAGPDAAESDRGAGERRGARATGRWCSVADASHTS